MALLVTKQVSVPGLFTVTPILQRVDEDDGITRYNCCVDYKPNHYAPVEFTKVKFQDLYTEVAAYFQALESKQTEWQN